MTHWDELRRYITEGLGYEDSAIRRIRSINDFDGYDVDMVWGERIRILGRDIYAWEASDGSRRSSSGS